MTKEEIKSWTQLGATVVLVGALVAGFLMGMVASEAFIGVVSMVVTYYFTDKKNTKELDATVEALRAEREQNTLSQEEVLEKFGIYSDMAKSEEKI